MSKVISLLLLLVFILGLAIFVHDELDVSRSPLFKYELVKDPKIYAYIQYCSSRLNQLIGPPDFKINRVEVRIIGGRYCRSGAVDKSRGEVFIGLSGRPGIGPDWQLYGAIAHEAMHTFRPNIGAPMMEGLCSIFARKMLKEKGFNWKAYDKFLCNIEGYSFHRESYLLVKELETVLDEKELYSMLNHVLVFENRKGTINSQSWIKQLSPAKRASIIGIMKSHESAIRESMKDEGFKFEFLIPE